MLNKLKKVFVYVLVLNFYEIIFFKENGYLF